MQPPLSRAPGVGLQENVLKTEAASVHLAQAFWFFVVIPFPSLISPEISSDPTLKLSLLVRFVFCRSRTLLCERLCEQRQLHMERLSSGSWRRLLDLWHEGTQDP